MLKDVDCPDRMIAVRGQPGRPALLLLHGLTGGPSDFLHFMRPWQQAGWSILAPLLPGHGDRPSALNTPRPGTLIDAALQAAEILTSNIAPTAPLLVAGLSQGALLAIHVAASRRCPSLIMAPPTHLGGATERVLYHLRRSGLDQRLAYCKEGGGDVSLPEEQQVAWSYPWMPMRAVYTLRRLIVATQVRLPELKPLPVWWCHGRLDHTAPLAGSRNWFNALGSGDDKVWREAEHSWHIVTRDCQAEELSRAAYTWSNTYL